MLGGVLVESIGFPRLMLMMGVLNLMFSPLVLIIKPENPPEPTEDTALNFFKTKRTGYDRFENE